jgi:hypothetical protein
MHAIRMETDDPFSHRAVSSHGITSERIGIELQTLASHAEETRSTAIGTKRFDASAGRSSVDVEPSSGLARKVSRLHSVIVIATLAGISFLNTMGSGILIAALPGSRWIWVSTKDSSSGPPQYTPWQQDVFCSFLVPPQMQ